MKRVVSTTELRTKCFALLAEVERGETLTITRQGKPVAMLSPVKPKGWKSPKGILAGKVKIVGNLVDYDSSRLPRLLLLVV